MKLKSLEDVVSAIMQSPYAKVFGISAKIIDIAGGKQKLLMQAVDENTGDLINMSFLPHTSRFTMMLGEKVISAGFEEDPEEVASEFMTFVVELGAMSENVSLMHVRNDKDKLWFLRNNVVLGDATKTCQ